MNQHYKFVNRPLPYSYYALEPYIDAKTMHLHHDKHLQTYIDNLNKALDKYPEYHSWSLEELIIQAPELPKDIRTTVSNNAGGVYNHFLYFANMSPYRQCPAGRLKKAITNEFTCMEVFMGKMKDAAMSIFGSGYAWLVADANGKLQIITTANQDTPLSLGLYPLMNIDVWEHAYYLNYYNKRADYIDSYFNLINWCRIEECWGGYFPTEPDYAGYNSPKFNRK